MKQKFLQRNVWIRIGIAVLLALVYGILSGPFVLRFIDGLSIASVLFLLAGVLTYWWKEGAFSYLNWKKEQGPYSVCRESVRKERAVLDNHSLYAGLILFAFSLVLTVLYRFL